MSIELAIALILAFIMIYIFLINVYSILFRLTGLTKIKARFQAISLLTNSGYTTSESEIITTNHMRRNIAIASMLTGYIFSVVIVSLVLNLINAVSSNSHQIRYVFIFIAFGIFIVILILFKIPFIKRPFERLIERIGLKIINKDGKMNIMTLLDSYGSEAIVQITLNYVPKVLKDKPLIDLKLRDDYNINMLMLKVNGVAKEITKNTVLNDGDIIIVFGPLQSIKRLFIGWEQIKRGKEEQK